MEEEPAIKLPGEFTGKGVEVIGDPKDPERSALLFFEDGAFAGMQIPTRELVPQWTPQTDETWKREKTRLRAMFLAHRLLRYPEDSEAANELAAIRRMKPRDRTAERAVNDILKCGKSPRWPARNNIERAAVSAIMKTAAENRRPPRMDEVTNAMRAVTDEIDGLNQRLATGEEKDIIKVVREMGFYWIESRRRGRPRNP